MGAPGHERFTVFGRQASEIGFDGRQFALDALAYPLQYQRGPGVGNILHGRAIVEPLPAFPRYAPLEGADQAEGGVVAGFESGPHLLKEGRVELHCAAGGGDGLRVGRRNQAEFGLCFGQGRQDLQPRARAGYLIKKLEQLRRSP
jgi:hypothetical protein